ncbi:MAG: hypothetical protein HYU99_06445 [Deltaproteobacteria bacterium]|nr:hypothetical protein [Deltaproteobacteria bacterium]
MKTAELLQMDAKGRVTLPQKVRGRSKGYFTYEVDSRGVIRLIPVVGVIRADQAWFWTKRWQAGEKAASEDIRKGRVTRVVFKDLKKFLKTL